MCDELLSSPLMLLRIFTMENSIHLVTLQKGIDDPQMATDLMSHGVEEVTSQYFQPSPVKKGMDGDKPSHH